MPDIDPDQLLKELDIKLGLMRANRRRPTERNQAVRIGILVLFGVVLIMALWVIESFLSQMTPHRNFPVQAPQAAGAAK